MRFPARLSWVAARRPLRWRVAARPRAFPGHNQPGQFSAIAKTPTTIMRVDSAMLDMMLTWDQSAGCVVAEISAAGGADDDDWMTHMLQSKVFEKVLPMNIQSIFMRMEPAPVRAGQIIQDALITGCGQRGRALRRTQALVGVRAGAGNALR